MSFVSLFQSVQLAQCSQTQASSKPYFNYFSNQTLKSDHRRISSTGAFHDFSNDQIANILPMAFWDNDMYIRQ